MKASEEALHKVTMNLFYSDVLWLEKHYGRGWSEIVRELVRKHRKERERE